MSIEEALAHPEARIHEYGDGRNVHKAVVAASSATSRRRSREADLRPRGHLLLRGQHPPADGAARGGGRSGARRQADALVVDPDAALRAPRCWPRCSRCRRRHIRVIAAPVGGGFGGKIDPFAHEIASRKLSQLTGRPVKITLHARGGLLLPPRPPSGADVGQDRRHAGRRDHRHALPHLARRRRLRQLRRGLDLLHRRAPDR